MPTYQEHSLTPLPRRRLRIEVVVCISIQHGGLVLHALIAHGANRLDGHCLLPNSFVVYSLVKPGGRIMQESDHLL